MEPAKVAAAPDPSTVWSDARAALRAATRLTDETATVRGLADVARLDPGAQGRVTAEARALVQTLRDEHTPGLMESLLAEYGLSNQEGVALMCLAEALLRVPDTRSIDALIRDKLAPAAWSRHLGQSQSALVNASTWGLMLTGRVLREGGAGWDVLETVRGSVRRLGEPVIRRAVGEAMKRMGRQFVLGRDIDAAMERARTLEAKGYTYSYDMLGEAARTAADARRYFDSYARAIAAIAGAAGSPDVVRNPGISIKLSSLHPRYEPQQAARCVPALVERVRRLSAQAKAATIGLTIDAEEQERLDLSLDVIEGVLSDPALAGWDGFGVVVQSYGPRSGAMIDALIALADRLDRRITVRLVKGAYWDAEIKRAQVLGLEAYPVFTRKVSTDVSYVAGAKRLLARTDRVFPQFATHNARTLATVLELAGPDARFEVQRLHGMGEALHEQVRVRHGRPCRIYAPVGVHEDLLAYLVRRILENGANSSFVNQILDTSIPVDTLVRDPVAMVDRLDPVPHPSIPAPPALYGAERRNSRGLDLTDPEAVAALEAARAPFRPPYTWEARPRIGAGVFDGPTRTVTNPARPSETVGTVVEAGPDLAGLAVDGALAALPDWSARPVAERAACLERAADLYEAHMPELMALATREAGKTPLDGVGEVREAVDFLRYYAAQARALPQDRAARGVFVCISPWNFPLAIFTGQIAAALVTGNTVIAKPAEQTALMAARAVDLLREAGVPPDVLALLPGDGAVVGGALTADPRVGGVCFTGSLETARAIQTTLARTGNAAAPLIAETGGLNAMIVDSTALPEQAVRDILASAFQSAGQRCSALRVLCLQEDIAARTLTMLKGAMDLLAVGDPWSLATDVGPVIDAEAKAGIDAHVAALEAEGHLIHRTRVPDDADGHVVAPVALHLDRLEDLTREVFGPVLHVVTWSVDGSGGKAGPDEGLAELVRRINALGYGLTLGLHSRIEARVRRVTESAHIGNQYVNRNQIGAIVGVQPFGGEGLSGTGPKAGGPHYLMRFTRAAGALTAPRSEPVLAQGTESADVLAGALAACAQAAVGWATRTDRAARLAPVVERLAAEDAELAAAARAGLAAAARLEPGPVTLPGPTGESNQLSLSPRGAVLCLGDGSDAAAPAVQQAVCALACGCAVVGPLAPLRPLRAALRGVDAPLATLDGWPAPEALGARGGPEHAALAGVALTGATAESARAVRAALAERAGPLVPLSDDPDDAALFVHERALSIDTTASGGNASLLAQVGAPTE
ncbi:bifunctional proline dehydrogenase/L-glutamate gamma-semialdehyde dehydrogenase PutA [Roseospira marina]|uniref:Bifunctional protein PutA n=1 Tax=Roseospira marina TaxID=140057 RepID=A0A5M6IDV8_9PROT|nr:bifunctional proline dehydrogenase/L-glutamate gamma-semialdehyde dehydrogenase PutA [Roseospira marina]KAA5606252.1 bifunctional proline dehydrogenase/L-glutamate gamma-semialdehyde dehydrogenase PutA [Roseospira marina]MBB4314407.1 RHH-type proline utilization regulon transcriptional repressor/proline dehydrogenase/delta 1-pyrroline-5-carboxylate dehydrogenase [Roseospira marina]MBB5087567.1 RHH-type proline utilization regulon transcriptional repressor/proline dehydrogenase/delta 1-pyrroli